MAASSSVSGATSSSMSSVSSVSASSSSSSSVVTTTTATTVTDTTSRNLFNYIGSTSNLPLTILPVENLTSQLNECQRAITTLTLQSQKLQVQQQDWLTSIALLTAQRFAKSASKRDSSSTASAAASSSSSSSSSPSTSIEYPQLIAEMQTNVEGLRIQQKEVESQINHQKELLRQIQAKLINNGVS